MAKAANIAVFHTKMIIGGGERLLIDMTKALQAEGNKVTIFVNEHNKNKCFEETINGTVKVEEIKTIFPESIFGHLSHICQIIRFLIIILKVLFFNPQKFDLVIVDEHPFAIPLIRLFRKKVIYYMHYPVKLVGEAQKGPSKLVFIILGFFEEFSLLFASKVFVNSNFIAEMYRKYFKIAVFMGQKPEVLYPIGEYKGLQGNLYNGYNDLPVLKDKSFFFSANRFCPNKNLEIAVEAYAKLSQDKKESCLLVLAGGLATEEKPMRYFVELTAKIKKLGLTDNVVVLTNIPQGLLLFLYSKCLCVLYTPVNEHFGIIPIEAQSYKCLVLAQNSGGPLETVGKQSGFLLPNDASEWTRQMDWVFHNPQVVDKMKAKGPDHVEQKFSFRVFAKVWEKTVKDLVK